MQIGNKEADCDKCKADCCNFIVFPLYSEDHERWAKYHNLEIRKIWNRKLIYMPIKCSKLKGNKCSIYKDRPDMCKEFDCNMFNMGIVNVK